MKFAFADWFFGCDIVTDFTRLVFPPLQWTYPERPRQGGEATPDHYYKFLFILRVFEIFLIERLLSTATSTGQRNTLSL